MVLTVNERRILVAMLADLDLWRRRYRAYMRANPDRRRHCDEDYFRGGQAANNRSILPNLREWWGAEVDPRRDKMRAHRAYVGLEEKKLIVRQSYKGSDRTSAFWISPAAEKLLKPAKPARTRPATDSPPPSDGAAVADAAAVS